ncbi:MAG: RNA recognition motif domain-containing protein [Candidatus Tectimicrobiota bacterium]
MHIFIGNLDSTTTQQELHALFASYGTVDTIRLISDSDTGQPYGFGFVEMPERSAARAAIHGLHGTDLAGQACTVNEAYWWVRDFETGGVPSVR